MHPTSSPRLIAPSSPDTPSSILSKFYLPLLLLLCAAYARTPLSGGIDFWAHAAIGRWIDSHGRVPPQSLGLWGAAPIDWVYHSWLSQWVFFKMLNSGDTIFGAGIAVAFTVVVVCAVYALLWRFWARQATPGLFAVGAFSLAIWCGSPRYHARPELFTAFFLTLLLIFLVARRNADLPPILAPAIVALFALWANFHGAVAFGLVILAIAVLADAIQDRCDVRWRGLFLLAVCCLAATLFNPYRAELWQALGAVRSTTFSNIEEWKPPWKEAPLPPSFIWSEIGLSFLSLVSWILNPRRRWSHLGWLIFAFASFASARRNLWLLAIVAIAVLAANAGVFDSAVWWRRWRALTQKRSVNLTDEPIPEVLRWIARGGALAILTIGVARALPTHFWPPRAISTTTPIRLSRFVREQNLRGRVFNDYEYSSYWQWAFAGRPPLFIDLLNAYPDRLMDDYFAVLNRTPDGLNILKRCDIVLMRPPAGTVNLENLQKFLDADPRRWACVYRRDDGTIWVRRNARYRRVWGKFEARDAIKKTPRR